MNIPLQSANGETTATKWERALKAFDLGWGPDCHHRLTITLPRNLYRNGTLSTQPGPHALRVFVHYDGRTLELAAEVSASTTQDDIELIPSTPMHYTNRTPLTLGIKDAREVVSMLMNHFCPEALEVRTM